MTSRIVVVGASLAGVNAAAAIRRQGFEGEVSVIGEEPHPPYDRPPLSKTFLTADAEKHDESRLTLRAVGDDSLDLTWMLGRRAGGVDLDRRAVTLDDGSELGYDGLVIATGARPRTLPSEVGGDLHGVVTLRTLDDARSLRAALRRFRAPLGDEPAENSPGGGRPSPRVLVVGAGFIGAEVAASARALGAEVIMIDLASTPLDRVLDTAAGQAVADLHRANGVDLRLGTGLVGLEPGPDGSVGSAVLTDGSHMACDLVVVGIGAVPNTEWLEGSGLAIDNGVIVDRTCRARPGVVAAGDVARWPNEAIDGRLMRVEQWDNAIDQGGYAGRRLLIDIEPDVGAGEAAPVGSSEEGTNIEPFAPVPWFWSDQYDVKIQLAGVTTDRAVPVAGSPTDGRFITAYLGDDERVLGLLCWNRPRQAILGRRMIADREPLSAVVDRLGS